MFVLGGTLESVTLQQRAKALHVTDGGSPSRAAMDGKTSNVTNVGSSSRATKPDEGVTNARHGNSPHERSFEGHGLHLGKSGRFFEDEGHRKRRRKPRRTTAHFNPQTTEWNVHLPTVTDGHMWRSLVVAAATHEYNPGEQHTSSRTTKVMVKVVTTEVTPTTRLVPRMVDSRK